MVGGWSANAFGVIQTGYPLSVTQTNNNSVLGASYQRPNATGVSPLTSGSTDDRINDWLNPAAFSAAPEFTFGDTSRFIDARGPGLFNWDLSLFKTFADQGTVQSPVPGRGAQRYQYRVLRQPRHTVINSSLRGDHQPDQQSAAAAAGIRIHLLEMSMD